MDETTYEPEEIDLRAYWQTLKKRRYTIAASLVLVVALAMALTFMQKPKYEATTKILSKGTGGSNQADLLSSTIPALGAFADQRTVQTQVEIVKSWPILKEAARRTGLDVAPGAVPVKVDGGKDTNIITITASSTDPRKAQLLANNVANVYMEENLDQARGSARAGRVFLENQEGKLKNSLEDASRALRDYQRRTGAVGLDAVTEKQVQALTDMETTLTSTRTDQTAAQARTKQLRDALESTSPNIVASSQIALNPSVQKLQDEIADLNIQRAGLLKDLAPTNLKVRAIDAQIAQASAREKELVGNIIASKTVSVNPIQQQLMGNLIDAEGASLAAGAKIDGLTRSIAEQHATLRQLPEQQYRLAELQRNVQIAEKTYLALQDRYQQLRIAEESTLANAQILEPALLPGAPVSPKPKLNFILSVLVGLMLGVGLAALQEALDDAIRTPEDVERELALPLLGIVHNIEDPQQRSLLRTSSLSGVAEAFRMIRSNIKFMGVDRSLRTVMVTSATKGEGKSTTAANLAMALAQDGKTVTLVDADLRRPSVHKQFGIPNDIGLTNAIVAGMPLSEVERDVNVENLRIITAGPIPPNPAELLDSARFARLIEELRTKNDMIVLDTPPVLGVADASVLGGRTDGVVLVTATGGVEKGAARRTVQMLQQARAHVLGVVLNKLDERQSSYYNYYYYQYYTDDSSNGSGSNRRRRRKHHATTREEN